MAPKNFVVVLSAFCTTLLLAAGISIIYLITSFDICCECFCYAIKDFMMFYKTVFFTFGVLLTVIAIFGFFAMIWEHKSMLDLYGKLLVFMLLIIFLILWLGLWGKGLTHLRTTLVDAFMGYENGSCRLISSIDNLQNKFHCCGIESPEDWPFILGRQEKLANGNWSADPPLSCCGNSIYYNAKGELKCFITYQSGCLAPVRRYIWRMFSIATVVGFIIALKTTLTAVSVFKWINILETNSITNMPEEILETNYPTRITSPIMPLSIIYHQDGIEMKNAPSSTVV